MTPQFVIYEHEFRYSTNLGTIMFLDLHKYFQVQGSHTKYIIIWTLIVGVQAWVYYPSGKNISSHHSRQRLNLATIIRLLSYTFPLPIFTTLQIYWGKQKMPFKYSLFSMIVVVFGRSNWGKKNCSLSCQVMLQSKLHLNLHF